MVLTPKIRINNIMLYMTWFST